jgi:ribonuclease P protein component
MIPRHLRLSRSDFENLADKRNLKRISSPHFSLMFGQTKDTGGCAVVVSKKVEKSSVGRHLLKRRVRAVLKEFCAKDNVLIVYAGQHSPTLSYEQLSAELTTLITQTGLFSGKV